MLHADEFEFTGEREVETVFVRWKDASGIRGFRLNLGKTKLMVSGASGTEPVQLDRYS